MEMKENSGDGYDDEDDDNEDDDDDVLSGHCAATFTVTHLIICETFQSGPKRWPGIDAML